MNKWNFLSQQPGNKEIKLQQENASRKGREIKRGGNFYRVLGGD